MKKKILLISSVLLTLSIVTIIIFNNMDNKENNIISNVEKDTEVINSNMITMMYETEAGTGIYEETKDTTWPENGYIFNENLSGCENGGELEYNSINNTVNLLSNKSDNCYVYFDKYDGVWIDNVSITNVTGSSVTLDISATSENGSITTYYYSLNDSEEYQETTSNPITINDLNKLTEYKISIYAIDSTNARSNIYEVIVTTIDESGPIINSVSVSNITTSGFTLTVDATSDVGIERYYFYLEAIGESNGGSSTTNSYTFNTLEDSTSYNINVFVEDSNGNYSNKYVLNVITDEIMSLANYLINQYGGIQGNNGIYYHTSSLANSAGDNSYRYAGGGDYQVTDIAINGGYTQIATSSSSDTNGVVNFYCDGTKRYLGYSCNNDDTIYYTTAYNETIHYSTYQEALEAAVNDGYLTADNIKNYVCFGSNSAPCPEDNLYRIIGAFGSEVKLIKSTSIGSYHWSGSSSNSSNIWSNSTLNTSILNKSYLTNLGDTWSNMIATHSWKVGGIIRNIRSDRASVVYGYEVGANSSSTTYSAKVGLMYISDYAFAVSPTYWTMGLNSYAGNTNRNNNWMYLGYYEWTISRNSDDSFGAHLINSSGGIVGYSIPYTSVEVRPVFYLNSNVQYASGDGSIDNPIRLIV